MMFGIPEHEEWRRYRQMWHRWGLHHGWRHVPVKKMRRGADATWRAGRRAQLPVPHKLDDMQHPRWARKVT